MTNSMTSWIAYWGSLVISMEFASAHNAVFALVWFVIAMAYLALYFLTKSKETRDETT